MSKIIDNIKCGNYEVVDNQGISVTRHFTQCLEKELADMEAKLAESESKVKEYANEITRRNTEQLDMQTRSFFKIRDLDTEILELKQQLAEKDKEINNLKELRKIEINDKKELRENQLQEIIKLEQQLAIYKRALELENEERFKNIDSIWMIEDDNKTKFINTAEELTNYFLDQAKEEQEKGETRC